MRPLDFLGRIKIKLGLVILLAVATAFAINEYGRALGVDAVTRMGLAALLSVGMVQLLGRGMTLPLREMAAAAQTIAKGRYGMRVSATSRDEVGELARAFNAMAADLGEVDRQRRELVANVSHELRTPIAGLQAVLENVVDGVSAPDPATLSTALAQTQRLGRLVAQLLDLSRLDSGSRSIEREPVELAGLCGQAVREAALKRDDVALTCDVPAGLGVHADPALLAQVLANLLDNGVRHSPPGGRVRVRARAEGTGVRLRVTDEGPGIPEPERPRVFERFSRLDAARAADAGGAGLGLAIVKEIVEVHGGSIKVADTPTGCHMVVDLPERTTTMPAPADPPPPPASIRTPAPSSASASALAPAPSSVSTSALAPASVSGLRAAHGPRELSEGTGAGHGQGREPGHGEPRVAAGTTASSTSDVRVAPLSHAREATPAVVSAPAAAEVSATTPGRDPGAPAVPEPAGGQTGAPAVREAETPATAGSGAVPGPAGPPAAGPSRYPGPEGYAMPPPPPYPVLRAPYRPSERTPQAATRWGKSFAGGLLGLVWGFVVGVSLAFFLVYFFGGGYGVVATLLFSAGGTVLGASLSYRSARSSEATAPPDHGGARPGEVYVPPPLLPRPTLPDTPRFVPALAAVVGLFAAITLPESRPGLGFVLVAIAVGAAVLPWARRRVTPWTAAFGLLAYSLVAVALFRDGDWLVGPMILAGFAMAALAVSGGGRSWLGVVRGGMSVLLALPPVPWFLAKPFKTIDRRRLGPVAAGLALSLVLILLFGLLFASADAVFSSFVERLFTAPDWAATLPFRLLVFVLFAALVAGATLVALRPVAEPRVRARRRRVNPTLWTTPLVAVNLLFLAFVTVQITTLFGGNRKVVQTAGLTYAEYARSGFFELVAVSVFVLAIVAVAAGLLAPEGRARWALAGLLGLLCALTMVVLASALHRLDLYIDAYGLSRLRASVVAAIWWLGAVFALVLAAGALRMARRGASWLPRTLVLVTALTMVLFAAWNPDLRVAESQIDKRGVARLDIDYLGDLGAEAVPAVDRLPEPARSCLLEEMAAASRYGKADPWNGWNLARREARESLHARPLLDRSLLSCEDIGSPGT
ncbi:hypothetical protein Ssi03_08380 [Sphaerisporangium siamense]|uniref:Signal transduction histidine-protein kinase/phosphatase MprB n=1 Tax=Sphaerisporangium siamense TaxID=795645 RepID=A0A7W7DF69_9ACTN|nr:DUF4153 domain-containing protein [Sphaerisporangium siamense]MBB4705765.1 signal transduction histidine kinase [Sphaerisporangium siamense]GII82848.1 hypothetical protein Ssi03_08380 [Sphaerisporangium siamense]